MKAHGIISTFLDIFFYFKVDLDSLQEQHTQCNITVSFNYSNNLRNLNCIGERKEIYLNLFCGSLGMEHIYNGTNQMKIDRLSSTMTKIDVI